MAWSLTATPVLRAAHPNSHHSLGACRAAAHQQPCTSASHHAAAQPGAGTQQCTTSAAACAEEERRAKEAAEVDNKSQQVETAVWRLTDGRHREQLDKEAAQAGDAGELCKAMWAGNPQHP